jgi:hypothetical protein
MFGHFASGVLEYALELCDGLCEIRIWHFEPSTFSCLPRGLAVPRRTPPSIIRCEQSSTESGGMKSLRHAICLHTLPAGEHVMSEPSLIAVWPPTHLNTIDCI